MIVITVVLNEKIAWYVGGGYTMKAASLRDCTMLNKLVSETRCIHCCNSSPYCACRCVPRNAVSSSYCGSLLIALVSISPTTGASGPTRLYVKPDVLGQLLSVRFRQSKAVWDFHPTSLFESICFFFSLSKDNNCVLFLARCCLSHF